METHFLVEEVDVHVWWEERPDRRDIRGEIIGGHGRKLWSARGIGGSPSTK